MLIDNKNINNTYGCFSDFDCPGEQRCYPVDIYWYKDGRSNSSTATGYNNNNDHCASTNVMECGFCYCPTSFGYLFNATSSSCDVRTLTPTVDVIIHAIAITVFFVSFVFGMRILISIFLFSTKWLEDGALSKNQRIKDRRYGNNNDLGSPNHGIGIDNNDFLSGNSTSIGNNKLCTRITMCFDRGVSLVFGIESKRPKSRHLSAIRGNLHLDDNAVISPNVVRLALRNGEKERMHDSDTSDDERDSTNSNGFDFKESLCCLLGKYHKPTGVWVWMWQSEPLPAVALAAAAVMDDDEDDDEVYNNNNNNVNNSRSKQNYVVSKPKYFNTDKGAKTSSTKKSSNVPISFGMQKSNHELDQKVSDNPSRSSIAGIPGELVRDASSSPHISPSSSSPSKRKILGATSSSKKDVYDSGEGNNNNNIGILSSPQTSAKVSHKSPDASPTAMHIHSSIANFASGGVRSSSPTPVVSSLDDQEQQKMSAADERKIDSPRNTSRLMNVSSVKTNVVRESDNDGERTKSVHASKYHSADNNNKSKKNRDPDGDDQTNKPVNERAEADTFSPNNEAVFTAVEGAIKVENPKPLNFRKSRERTLTFMMTTLSALMASLFGVAWSLLSVFDSLNHHSYTVSEQDKAKKATFLVRYTSPCVMLCCSFTYFGCFSVCLMWLQVVEAMAKRKRIGMSTASKTRLYFRAVVILEIAFSILVVTVGAQQNWAEGSIYTTPFLAVLIMLFASAHFRAKQAYRQIILVRNRAASRETEDPNRLRFDSAGVNSITAFFHFHQHQNQQNQASPRVSDWAVMALKDMMFTSRVVILSIIWIVIFVLIFTLYSLQFKYEDPRQTWRPITHSQSCIEIGASMMNVAVLRYVFVSMEDSKKRKRMKQETALKEEKQAQRQMVANYIQELIENRRREQESVEGRIQTIIAQQQSQQ